MKLWPFSRQPKAEISEGLLTALLMGEATGSSRATLVTPETVFASTAVLACLIVRAETISSLPCHVYRHVGERRERQDAHSLARLLSGRWNELLTAGEGWRWEQITEDVRGNAYVRVEYRGSKVVALWPLTATVKLVGPVNGKWYYEYAGDDVTPQGTYPSREILHFRGPVVRDARYGSSLVSLAAQSIGISIDTEKFYGRLLANGSHFPGYLQTDESLRPEDRKALEEQLKGKSGVFTAGELRIFDRGLKYVQNAMSIKDADLTQEQLWALQQVCRVFRIPPPLVQDFSRSTYTNSEQADLWFAKHTIVPLAVNKERVLARVFEGLGSSDRDLYVKFALDGLLRGDFRTRAEGYSILVNCGVMTRQQARGLEDWDPLPGLEKPLVPLNMRTIGPDGETEEAPPAVRAAPAEPAAALAKVREDYLVRARKRVAQDRQRGRDTAATLDWLRAVFAPLAEAYRLVGVAYDLDAEIGLLVAGEEEARRCG